MRKKEEEIFEKIMEDCFPVLIKTINPHNQEAQHEYNQKEKNPKVELQSNY